MTQVEAAEFLAVSRRSYQSYENDDKYQGSIKYNYVLEKLLDLFGSYAKGKAREESDVDLLIATNLSGLKFFGLVEELKAVLRKKVDVLELSQLEENKVLLNEILKDGIKIFG